MSRSASLHTLPLTRKVGPEWVITEVNLGPANLCPERLHPQTCCGRAHRQRSCWRAFIQKVKHRNISAAQQLDVCSESLLRFTSVKNINEWGRCSCWAVRWCLYIYSRHTYIYISGAHKEDCLSFLLAEAVKVWTNVPECEKSFKIIWRRIPNCVLELRICLFLLCVLSFLLTAM